MTTTFPAGAPCWADVSGPDIAALRAFYSRLFGWEVVEGPPETGGYANFTLGGRMTAGSMPTMSPEQPPSWNTYFAVEDADAAAAAIEKAGGATIAPPMQVLDLGRMAVFTAPDGAPFGIWQPEQHRGFEAREEPNTLCWFELHTPDVAAALQFYSAALGWTSQEVMPGYTVLRAAGEESEFGGMTAGAQESGAHPLWHPYIAVADVDAVAAEADAAGGTVTTAPQDIPGVGRMAAFLDPQGAAFSVLAPNPREGA